MKYCRVVLSDSSNNKTTHCLKNLYLYERSLGDDSFKNLVKLYNETETYVFVSWYMSTLKHEFKLN